MQKKRGDFLPKDIKGQGLSVNAIILIILGLVVLVILILGFTVGWNKIFPFVKSNNVQNIVTACETACTTGAKYDYCTVQREVNDGTNPKIKDADTTCEKLASGGKYTGRNYGVEICSAITCATETPPAP
ncbi:hypothetical protein J4422_03400 [Candidatus Pacearchaeota archaeon]|nr:hypothetical protein [Candidatus Pacearchaeota archaeon]